MTMKDRNLQIEGLRGIAMMFVVCSHYFARFPIDYVQGANPFYFLGTEYWGEMGVSVFLLISGYFMVPKKSLKGSTFLFKRLRNIWPLYFAAITIIFLVTRLIYLPGRTVSFFEYLLNIPLLNGFIAKPYVDHAHWYLATLIGATVVFAFLIGLKPTHRHIAYCAWIILLTALYFLDSKNTILHLARSGLFFFLGKDYSLVIILGALMADYDTRRMDKLGILAAVLAFTAKGLIGSVSKLIELPFMIIFFSLCAHSNLRFLGARFFTWLGSISFSTYLIHQNMGYIFLLLLVKGFGSYSLWMSFAALPFGLILGTGFHVIEKWMNHILPGSIGKKQIAE